MISKTAIEDQLKCPVPKGFDAGFPHVCAERSEALGKSQNRCTPLTFKASGIVACEAALDRTVEVENATGIARKVRWEMKAAIERLLPESRTARCRKRILYGRRDKDGQFIKNDSVSIYQSTEHKSPFYAGLETCSSVWICPNCASIISERRRQELKGIQTIWEGKGGKLYMITFTFRHGKWERLKDVLGKFAKARSYFCNRKTWRAWGKTVGLCHWIYCLEVTHGENGWHVHLHQLLFIKPESQSKEPKAEDLLLAWQNACVSAGLGMPNKHGLDIRDGTEATQYISKWGIDLELTKQHVKKGREGHRTPFDLLRDYANGDLEAGNLFKEFASVFKGKRQLVYSRGLRNDLEIGKEKSDEQLAEEKIDQAVCLGSLSRADWKLVLRHEARAEILEVARIRGWEGVRDALEFLEMLPEPWKKPRVIEVQRK